MPISRIVDDARRKARSIGGRLIRRLHLLPGGMPDGLGEDDELASTSLSSSIIVFFADTPDSLYQLADWYRTLEEVDRQFGVTVICMDSRTGRAIREATSLHVIVVARDATIDDLLLRSDVAVCLYVNHTPQNLLMLRAPDVIHVAFQHGDSDKAVSISNQIKAYDFAFMAGQAAVDRLARNLMLYDAAARCITVGYPEIDVPSLPTGVSPRNGNRVLYAPTWEGGHPSVAYSSVISHGYEIIRALTKDGFDVIYRPHPLTGVRLAEFASEDARLRDLVSEFPSSRVSVGLPLAVDFESSDILITDVSAVANHWLRTGKPLIVTEPTTADAAPANMGYLDVVPRLRRDAAERVSLAVRRELKEDPSRDARLALMEYYFSSGSVTQNVIEALHQVIDIRVRERGRLFGGDA